MRRCFLTLGIAHLFLLPFFAAVGEKRGFAADSAADSEFFEKKIRPLLATHCFACHGPESKKKGNLRLDSRASLLKGGDTGPAMVPRHPENSLLIRAIGYKDVQLRMPPKSKLADEQIADLTRWIELGAPWPDRKQTTENVATTAADKRNPPHKLWSLQPLQSVPSPSVHQNHWPLTSVDSFILAKLEAAGLSPAPSADKRTLIRRVTYDLIGLPPAPEEMDAFLGDSSPDAFAKVVDRLLASAHYGERWGRHWLDLVRFAESSGHEYDFEMPDAYQYRDYVIRALNADVPYDQFLIEHLAGDLLPQPRRHPTERFNESILATGFFFLGESKQAPVDIRGEQADRFDNQLDVFGKTFLGLTVACARCHDHKFDPISTRDYYALAGYLLSSRYQRAFLDNREPNRRISQRIAELRAKIRPLAIEETARSLQREVGNRIDSLRKGPPKGDPLHFIWSALLRDGASLSSVAFVERKTRVLGERNEQRRKSNDFLTRSVIFEDFSQPNYRDWDVAGEAFGNGPTCDDSPWSGHGPIVKGVAHSGLVSDRFQGVLRSKTFTIEKNKILYRAAGDQAKINLIIDGFQQIRAPIYGGLTIPLDKAHSFAWRVQDVAMWKGHRAYIELIDDGPGYLAVERILFADEAPPPKAPNPYWQRLLENPAVDRPEKVIEHLQTLALEMIDQWRGGRIEGLSDRAERYALLLDLLRGNALKSGGGEDSSHQVLALSKKLDELERSIVPPRRAMALADGTPEDERLHIRGSHKSRAEVIPRHFLEALAGASQPEPKQGSGRLELAQRMIQTSSHLLVRVLVNRIWQQHFGEGIVRSPDNFGAQGQPPTHPELLDYLAGEFIRQNWSVKKLHRLLLLSRTYQMASRAEDWAEQVDPQNLLWHRMPIHRLEAESIRDALLAVSGQLNLAMYGPGVMPYLTPFMEGRGRPATSGPLDGNGRRSIYINVRRNFLTPLFLAFDYPIPFTTIGRGVSNVPAQALTLMNNPFVVQQAERWAKRLLDDPGLSREQRVVKLYLMAFARPPASEELADALIFLDEQGRRSGQADEARVWSDLCHVLINVKEFIFID